MSHSSTSHHSYQFEHVYPEVDIWKEYPDPLPTHAPQLPTLLSTTPSYAVDSPSVLFPSYLYSTEPYHSYCHTRLPLAHKHTPPNNSFHSSSSSPHPLVSYARLPQSSPTPPHPHLTCTLPALSSLQHPLSPSFTPITQTSYHVLPCSLHQSSSTHSKTDQPRSKIRCERRSTPPSNPDHPLTSPTPSPSISPPPASEDSNDKKPIAEDSVKKLEEILEDEQSDYIQVRAICATIAHLTKDVLASGKACPLSFVSVLKQQLTKLHATMAKLHLADERKASYEGEFVQQVMTSWQKRNATKVPLVKKRQLAKSMYEAAHVRQKKEAPIKLICHLDAQEKRRKLKQSRLATTHGMVVRSG